MQASDGWTDWTRVASADALERFGAAVAARLGRGEAVCLFGPLGAGKTTLSRGLIRALTGPEEETPSPTFTLVQVYETPAFALAHFDLYRLRSAREVEEIGLEEALDVGAAVVEWSERLADDLPAHRLEVELSVAAKGAAPGPPGGRWLRWRGRGAWRGRELGVEC